MPRAIGFFILSSLVCATSLIASPLIEVTPAVFKCGPVPEGKTDTLRAKFIVKNTGDSLLRIENVRPGCGCTVVRFDSLIAPGKTATIRAEVHIANYPSGPISKTMTVSSNAKNKPRLELTVTASIQGIIELSTQYVDFPSGGTEPLRLALASRKKSLRVLEVSFVNHTESEGAPEWQKNIPVQMQFKWSRTDSLREDGYTVYTLELSRPPTQGNAFGEIVIKTNHPDKEELRLQATIAK